jgi:ABC-type glycerol-3-phosphate transport system substrate-binding protein
MENASDASFWRRTAQARTLGLAVPLLLLASLLVGCTLLQPGPPATESVAEETPTPALTATATITPGVTILVFWEPLPLDRAQGLLLGEMVRDFHLQNRDVVVELVPWSGYASIHDAILAGLHGSDLPDLAVAFPAMIAEYAAAGAVAPLDPFLTDAELGLSADDLADLVPATLDAGRMAGSGREVLAFPFAQNAVGMWANDSLLAEAGWNRVPATWEEFEQACYDVAAQAGMRCYPYVESVSTFSAWLYSRGGRLLDPAARRATFNEPPGVESLALLRRLMDAGLAWRPEETYGDYQAFANGQAAFTFSSTGNSPFYVDAYQGALHNGVAPFRWHQALIPQANASEPATLLYGSSFVILTTDPARQRAAWRLIRWFTEAPQGARWAADLETLPVRLSALEYMTDTLAAYPFVLTQVQGILRNGRPEPMSLVGLEVQEILHTAILSVTQGYADPQTALDQAALKANAALSRQP